MAVSHKQLALPLGLLLTVLLIGGAHAQPPSCSGAEPSNSFSMKTVTDSASLYVMLPPSGGDCQSDCFLNLVASQNMVRNAPGKPPETLGATLSLMCYARSSCGPNFQYLYKTSDSSGVNISPRSASIVTTLDRDDTSYYSDPNAPTPAYVNVQAQVDGSSTEKFDCNSKQTVISPCGVTTVSRQGGSNTGHGATFTGTITIGSTTYTLPFANATPLTSSINKNEEISRVVVKTH